MADDANIASQQEIPPEVADAVRKAHQLISQTPKDDEGNLSLDPEVQKANQVLQAYQAKTQPHYEGNILIPASFKPIELNAEASNDSGLMGKIGNVAHGVAAGVAEAANPLAIPHSLETIGRAAFQDQHTDPNQGLLGRIGQALTNASNSSVSNPMDMDTVDRVLNTLVKGGSQQVVSLANKVLGDNSAPAQSLSDIYDSEVARQNKANAAPGYAPGKLVGEIGTAAAGTIYTGLKAISGIKGLAESLLGLKGADAMQEAAEAGALNPEKYLQVKQLSKDLLGSDLPKDMQSHLFQTDTDDISKMLKGGPESVDTLPIAEKIQTTLQNSKEFLADAVGQLRSTLVADKNTAFDTKFVQKAIDGIQSDFSYSGGKSALNPTQGSLLTSLKSDLENPISGEASNLFTTKDADVMINKLDTVLQPYYKALDTGQKPDPFLSKVFQIRQGLDDGLAEVYPAFKQAKTAFSTFLNQYTPFQSALGENKAEGFVSRLFGPNKGQLRQNFQELLNSGKKAVDSFKNLGESIDGDVLSGNKDLQQVVTTLQNNAQQMSIPNGEQVVNEIINREIAKRLSSLKDVNEDVKARLINEYVADHTGGLLSKGMKAIGGFAGSPFGTGGVLVGSEALGGLTDKIQSAQALAKAKSYYTPENLLNLITQAKSPTPPASFIPGGIVGAINSPNNFVKKGNQ